MRTAWQKPAPAAGFTLIELLLVIGLMAILMTLLAPAVGGFGKSRALEGAGKRVSALLDLSRQNAMSRNSLTALVVATDGTAKYRAFTILEAQPKSDGSPLSTSDWKQVNRWEILPEGIAADQNPFSSSSTTALLPALPDLVLQGAPLPATSLRYVAFLPTGKVYNATSPSSITLVEGVWEEGTSPTYTQVKTGSKPANFYDICVLPATGMLKVHRP
jgi:prepilin-type N-terminal cleavage/methylation domain-containing protein